ncbi:MAG: hypothetical protein WC900_00575 [Oscillospiraceae bacterium]|jgi:hypothetical protein
MLEIPKKNVDDFLYDERHPYDENIFIHENLEERKKAFNKIFVDIINKSEGENLLVFNSDYEKKF